MITRYQCFVCLFVGAMFPAQIFFFFFFFFFNGRRDFTWFHLNLSPIFSTNFTDIALCGYLIKHNVEGEILCEHVSEALFGLHSKPELSGAGCRSWKRSSFRDKTKVIIQKRTLLLIT